VADGPAPFTRPPGGAVTVARVPGGRRIVIARRDGSRLAEAELDRSDVYRSVRYFDRRGRLRLVVDRLDAAPALATARTAVAAAQGCRDARNPTGAPWGAFPINWRLNARSVPRRLPRAGVVRAAQDARAAWGANRNRCGVPDASRVAFRYRGATRLPVGRNGVSSIGFGSVAAMGGVCRGALACTFTWVLGGRGIESDTRLDARPARPYSLAGGRADRTDLASVIVHETGHTLGFAHVYDPSNVMYPWLIAGTTSHRRLGLGDARENNGRY